MLNVDQVQNINQNASPGQMNYAHVRGKTAQGFRPHAHSYKEPNDGESVNSLHHSQGKSGQVLPQVKQKGKNMHPQHNDGNISADEASMMEGNDDYIEDPTHPKM